LTTNIDIDDRLVNGQLGTVKHIKVLNRRCEKVYVLFDDAKAGNKRKNADDFARRYGYVLIEKTEGKFGISTNKREIVTVTWTQFPLILAYACTVHKVQGLTLQKIVVSFQLHKQHHFHPGQMYVALSRVTSLDGLYLIGNFSASAIRSSEKAEKEYQRFRSRENLLEPLLSCIPTEENLVLTMLNIRSLRPKSASIRHHKELNDSDVLFFTETQISHDANIEEVEYNLRPFKMVFNNDADKFKSLAIGHRDYVTLIDQHVSGFSMVELRKTEFSDKIFKILLLYRSRQETLGSFFDKLTRILVEEPNTNIITGDFNIDLLKESVESEALSDQQHLFQFSQLVVDFPTHVDGGLLDHIYVRTSLYDQYSFTCFKYCTNLSDHDVLKVEVVKE